MSIAAVFAVLANAARIAQDAAVAWRYGTGPMVDAFYFVSSVVNWPVAVALSTLTLALVPTEATLERGLPSSAQHFRAELLGAVLALALIAAPLAALALHALGGSRFSGLGDAAAAHAVAWAPVMAAAMSLGLVGALFSAWLIARANHLLTLVEGLPALVLLGALLVAPGVVLFWGTALGVIVQILAMAWLLGRGRGLSRPRWTISAEAWRPFVQGATAMLAGQMLFALFPLVDPFFAARLGEGVVATLGFANRLVLGVQGLAGLALQRAGLPLLSRLMVSSPAEARRAALRWAAAAAAVGVLLGAAVALLADPLVAMLFERGSFTSEDSRRVAELLRFGMLQMPPFLAGLVLVTALASARAGLYLALLSGAGLFLKLTASALLVGRFGVHGLLIGTAVMYTGTALLAWLALRRNKP